MQPSPARFQKHVIPLLLLVILTAVVYRDMLHQSFLTNWDDELYVTGNAAAQGITIDHLRQAFTSFFAGNYAPLQIISYMLDFEAWGKWAGGYKLTNLIFHLMGGTLLYITLIRHFRATRLAAWCAALLFLCHPVQVESVAWISQRKTVLSGACMVLALLCWLEDDTGTKSGRWRLLAGLAYLAALLTKATTAVLLPILLIHQWLTQRRVTLRDKLPIMAATAAMVAVTLVSQSPEQNGGITSYHGGSPLATLLTMVTVLPSYLAMIARPIHLSAFYAPTIRTGIDLAVVSSIALLAIMAGLGWHLTRTRPLPAFWYLSFFVALLPVSQVVPINTIMNDRYLYLPLLGVAGLTAWVVQGAQLMQVAVRRHAATTSMVALLLALPWLTSRQVPVWNSSITLWNKAVDTVPQSPEAWTGLAHAYQKDNKLAAALGAYLRSIALKQDNDIALNNIALLYLTLGKTDKAEEYAKHLLAVNKSAVAYTTVAMVYFDRKDYAASEQMLRHALSKDSTLETALTLMGNVATEQGRFVEARQFLNRSMELHGPIGPVLFAMATLESAMGNREKSARLFIRSLEAGYRDSNAIRASRQMATIIQQAEMRQIIKRFIPDYD